MWARAGRAEQRDKYQRKRAPAVKRSSLADLRGWRAAEGDRRVKLGFARNPSFCIATATSPRAKVLLDALAGASRLDYRQVAPYRDPTAWLGM
jgi:hypothetical protein